MNARRHAYRVASLGAVVVALAAAQCPRQQAETPAESDSLRVARLEGEAKALVSAQGCSSPDQCLTAPVGDRPCGGPRLYFVYCARTTDTVALNRKLAELAAAEREYNQKRGLASTCEYRLPPQTALVAGSCQATSAR